MKRRFVLIDLPLAARLTLAVFLLAVGLGYCSALVQLHFQQAAPGQLLPSPDDVVRTFHGFNGPPISKMESLISADESRPFNGTGSMAAAFTKKSDGWSKAIKQRAKSDSIAEPAAEAALRIEREGERQALLAWVKAGLSKDDFAADKFPWPADRPLSSEFRDGDAVKIKSLFTERCTRCHAANGDDQNAVQYPMESYEQILKYGTPISGGQMSLEKLAQTTHTHLLSFAMLFAFTGLLFALTRYPAIMRVVIAPSVLLAQVADISCWWLARLEGNIGEQFALAIPITGMVVGSGLAIQIVLTLFELFHAFGRLVLLIVFALGGYGGYVVKERYIDPELKNGGIRQAGQAKAEYPWSAMHRSC